MSTTTTKQVENLSDQIDTIIGADNVQPLTVLTMVKTMLEIIKIKKDHMMDIETRQKFPVIAKEIILLAEQTQ